jgi:hypothetical protein
MATQPTGFVELVAEPKMLDEPSISASQRWLLLLTPFVILLHGYHSFADDAGIYVTGVVKIVSSIRQTRSGSKAKIGLRFGVPTGMRPFKYAH